VVKQQRTSKAITVRIKFKKEQGVLKIFPIWKMFSTVYQNGVFKQLCSGQ
jgi:hypothetical protein